MDSVSYTYAWIIAATVTYTHRWLQVSNQLLAHQLAILPALCSDQRRLGCSLCFSPTNVIVANTKQFIVARR